MFLGSCILLYAASLTERVYYNLSIHFDPDTVLCAVIFLVGLETVSVHDDGELDGGWTSVLLIGCSRCFSWIDLISLTLMHLLHFETMMSVIHLNDDIVRTLDMCDNVVDRGQILGKE